MGQNGWNAHMQRWHTTRWISYAMACVVALLLVGCLPVPSASKATDTQSTVLREETVTYDESVVSTQPDVVPSQDANAAQVTTSDFQNKVTTGEYRSIRLVGDSITAGFGTDGYEDSDLTQTGNVIYDDGMGTQHFETDERAECWANAFRAWAMEHGITDFVNAGISGWFMKQLAQNPDAWIQEGADVIVVSLGTNDAGYYGPDEFAQDARVALEAAEQRSKLVVVLSPVSDLRPESMLVEPASQLGDILKEICDERGYMFVDTRSAVLPGMFCEDGLHPNTEGSLAIWQCLATTLGIA